MQSPDLINEDNLIATLTLSSAFTLRFSVQDPVTSAPSGDTLSMLELREATTGASLLSVVIENLPSPLIKYNNMVVSSGGLTMANDPVEWTRITMILDPGNGVFTALTETTNMLTSATAQSFSALNLDGLVYELYASSPGQGTSGGVIQDVEITGSNCVLRSNGHCVRFPW